VDYQMNVQLRRGLHVAFIALAAAGSASGQLVTYGVGEVGARETRFLLLGAALSGGGTGWKPVVSAQAYHLSFRGGSRNVFAPSGGLVYQTAGGAWQGRVGYSFVSGDNDLNRTTGTSAAAASEDGVFTVLQGDYWGTGARSAQFISSYNFEDGFLWGRVRSAQRIGGVESRVMLGGEVGGFVTGSPSPWWSMFLGPTLRYKVSNDFALTGAVGYAAGPDRFGGGTAYGKIDFVYLIPFSP
jgi:hypothetical protein